MDQKFPSEISMLNEIFTLLSVVFCIPCDEDMSLVIQGLGESANQDKKPICSAVPPFSNLCPQSQNGLASGDWQGVKRKERVEISFRDYFSFHWGWKSPNIWLENQANVQFAQIWHFVEVWQKSQTAWRPNLTNYIHKLTGWGNILRYQRVTRMFCLCKITALRF